MWLVLWYLEFYLPSCMHLMLLSPKLLSYQMQVICCALQHVITFRYNSVDINLLITILIIMYWLYMYYLIHTLSTLFTHQHSTTTMSHKCFLNVLSQSLISYIGSRGLNIYDYAKFIWWMKKKSLIIIRRGIEVVHKIPANLTSSYHVSAMEIVEMCLAVRNVGWTNCYTSCLLWRLLRQWLFLWYRKRYLLGYS